MHVMYDLWCHEYCMRLNGDEMLICWNGKYDFCWMVGYLYWHEIDMHDNFILVGET